jgi:perosamine synthetase
MTDTMIPIAKPIIGETERKLIAEVLDSGVLVQGPKVREFEKEFAELCETKYAIAVNSGTAALHTALYAIGIRPGDEVITTPFTFVASANSILMQGARPVFADIDPKTYNLDPDSVVEKITPKTRAILAVDLFGQVYDHKAIGQIASDHRLKVVEDACQAVDAMRDGKMAGSVADMGAFSLYPTKNITAGEGGVITTDDARYAERAREFRHHGQPESVQYVYHDLGYNYRLSEVHAAIALGQLSRLKSFTEARIRNADLLDKGLKGIRGLTVPYRASGAKHVFHQYTLRVAGFVKQRDELVLMLREKGIGCNVYYPKPLHLYPMYQAMGYKEGDFPVSEQASKEALSLPCHPGVSSEDIRYIVETMKDIAQS